MSKPSHTAAAAGCLQRRKARDSGAEVSIYRNADADMDDQGGPYSTVCEDHGTVVAHRTLRQARRQAAAPLDWCIDCLNQRLNACNIEA